MKKLLTILTVCLLTFNIHAQQTDVEKYKAVFITNMIRFVNWPNNEGDFIIGVVKDKQIVNYLNDNVQGKKYGYQTVVIKLFNTVNDITQCNVLYMPSHVSLSKNNDLIKQKTKNTLLITDTDGNIKYGSAINFVIVDDRLKFQVSKNNAAKMQLQISSKLETLNNAIIVD